MEQNNFLVAGLLGFDANAFLARAEGGTFYGVMLATRATAAGNLAQVLNDGGPTLSFVVSNAASFAKAANAILVQP